MKIGLLRQGLAIYDRPMDLMIAKGKRDKTAFERQLANSLWERIKGGVGVRYQPTFGSPRWYPPTPVPSSVNENQIIQVWVLMKGGNIVLIHWGTNKKAAQNVFRQLGWTVVG